MINMNEILKMGKRKEKEYSIIMMVINIKEILKMKKGKEREYIIAIMVILYF